MRIERRYTKEGQSPYTDVEFRLTSPQRPRTGGAGEPAPDDDDARRPLCPRDERRRQRRAEDGTAPDHCCANHAGLLRDHGQQQVGLFVAPGMQAGDAVVAE